MACGLFERVPDPVTADESDSAVDDSSAADADVVETAGDTAVEDSIVAIDSTTLDTAAIDSPIADSASDSMADSSDADVIDSFDSTIDTGVDTNLDTAACSKDEYRCDGNMLQQCNAGRSGWSDFQQCAVCDARRCLEAVDVSANNRSTCAVIDDGSVWCWGTNAGGQVGNGHVDDIASPVLKPSKVLGLTTPSTRVFTGNGFACALLADNTAACWGYNANGNLGDGTKTDHYTAAIVPSLTDVKEMAALDVTCALLKDGSVKCWGDNTNGLVGDGSTAERLVPTAVTGLGAGTTFAIAGRNGAYVEGHLCAMLSAGSVSCWGLNDYQQVTHDLVSPHLTPVTVAASGGTPVLPYPSAISLGADFSCGVMSDGTVQCWGNGRRGAFGAATAESGPLKLTVPSGPIAAFAGQLACGYAHVCAVMKDGTLSCWGKNSYGQLGDGTTVSRPTSASVSLTPPGGAPGLTKVMQVAAGDNHTCAIIRPGGGVWCWGWNHFGQLGDGTEIDRPSPTAVRF